MSATIRPWCHLLCVLLLCSAATTVAETPDDRSIEGVWLVEEEDAKVEIAPCGEAHEAAQKLCGEIVWLREPLNDKGLPKVDDQNPDPGRHQRPILGLRILDGFDRRADERGLWTGGTVYDPNNGKTYRCQISFEDPDTLKIRGYVGFSLLGRTSRWTRSEAP